MIKREIYMKRIRPFIGGELVKVITGMRRTGKSVMMRLIEKELLDQGVNPAQIISMNFEDLEHSKLLEAEKLHEEILRRAAGLPGKVYLFFDEIQEVREWERCVNSLRVRLDCDIYLTGANARLLSGELATYLAGRYVEFVIYPFSFAEYLEAARQETPDLSEEKGFSAYLKTGGMPYLTHLRFEPEASRQYLQDIFNSVVLKDIVKRNSVRNVDLLERVLRYAVQNSGNTFSANNVARFLKSERRTVSVETVLNYLKFCTEAFLCYKVPRQDLRGRALLSTQEKIYLADHGFRDAVFGRDDGDVSLVLENIACLEFLRRGYRVSVGKNGTREIDFFCERGNEKFYAQIAYVMGDKATREREFSAFEGLRDSYPRLVLSMDEVEMGRDGIRHCNLRDFLLQKDWRLA